MNAYDLLNKVAEVPKGAQEKLTQLWIKQQLKSLSNRKNTTQGVSEGLAKGFAGMGKKVKAFNTKGSNVGVGKGAKSGFDAMSKSVKLNLKPDKPTTTSSAGTTADITDTVASKGTTPDSGGGLGGAANAMKTRAKEVGAIIAAQDNEQPSAKAVGRWFSGVIAKKLKP